MKTLFTTIFAIGFLCAFGQDYKKTYTQSGDDISASVTIDNESLGIVIAGNNRNEGLIYCVDTLGDILWQKNINISEADPLYRIEMHDLITTFDSSFLLTGSYRSLATSNPQLFVLKFTADGTFLWYNGFGANNTATRSAVTNTIDSSYLIVSGTGDTGTAFSMFKIEASGNVVWTTAYNTGAPTTITGIDQFTDTSFFLSGFLTNSTSSLDGFVAEITDAGDVNWTTTYEDWTVDDIKYDGNRMILTGFVSNGANLAYIAFADTFGNMYVTKRAQLDNYNSWSKKKIALLADTTILLVLENGAFASDCMHLDTNGFIIDYFEAFMFVADVMPTQNGGALFLGNGPLPGVKALYNNEITTVRLDTTIKVYECIDFAFLNDSIVNFPITETLQLNPGTPIVPVSITVIESTSNLLSEERCTTLLGDISEHSKDALLNVYPNVSDGTFHFVATTNETYDIQIFSSLGAQVWSTENISGGITVDLSGYSSGSYYYNVNWNDGNASNGLLLLQY